jgi:hypothetical protein
MVTLHEWSNVVHPCLLVHIFKNLNTRIEGSPNYPSNRKEQTPITMLTYK